MAVSGRVLGLLIFFFVSCAAEVFTSIEDIKSSVEYEGQLTDALDEYIRLEEVRLEKLRAYIKDLRSHPEKSNGLRIENPVAAFRLVRRLSYDWMKFAYDTSRSNSNHLKTTLKNWSIPDMEDFHGSIDGLLRLQKTYAISESDMANGNLTGNDVVDPDKDQLSAIDCFLIGRHTFLAGNHNSSSRWMTVALRRLGYNVEESSQSLELRDSHNGLNFDSEFVQSVLDHLAYAQYELHNYNSSVSFAKELLHLNPEHPRAQSYIDSSLVHDENSTQPVGPEITDSDEAILSEELKKRAKAEEEMSSILASYVRTCAGFVPEKTRLRMSRLRCRYRVPHPYYTLAPLKEEIAHINPRIMIWYDVLHDPEIEEIIALSKPELQRAGVGGNATADGSVYYRISKSAWFNETDSDLFKTLDVRFAQLTGLSMTTAEPHQVVNYGIGGQYEPHYDFATEGDPIEEEFGSDAGNRVATMLFYLSDVEAGGGTAFTRIGLNVSPKKGSAVFWYNLFRNGNGAYKSEHAGCPVLKGSKWVMNKWIHERGQEFLRPCSVNKFV